MTRTSPRALRAIRVCLNVRPEERVTIITDRDTAAIAESLSREIDSVGARQRLFVLEDLAARPLKALPAAVAEDMETSDVSIFAAQAQPGELRSRMDMTDIVNRRHMRHAHMVNITRQIMCEGMRADYTAWNAQRKALEIVAAQGDSGDDTRPAATCGRRSRRSTAGSRRRADRPEKWGNLPGGEIFTTPEEVNGVFVVDGVVGDWLCDRYGLLRDAPLTLQIARNRLVSASSANEALRRDFWEYTHTDENSDRVGEFAIGTNIELRSVIGHILQDEKFPGLHIAFGNPYGAHTGAEWDSGTHIDVVGTEFDIWVDGRRDHARRPVSDLTVARHDSPLA